MSGVISTHRRKEIALAVGLVLTLVAVASVAEGQDCIPPPEGLVAWWPGDGDATDLAGGNHGILEGSVTFPPGRVEEGFGIVPDNAVVVPDSDDLDLLAVTLDAWIRMDSAPGEAHFVIVTKGLAGNGENYGLYVHPNMELNLEIWIGYDHVWHLSSGAGLTVGTFHHVAVTADGTTVRFFVDGQPVSEVSQYAAMVPNEGDLQIGRGLPYSNRFNGVIDEVEIFDRALAEEEIRAIFEAGSAGKCKGLCAAIDIKPGSDPNCFNLNGHGVIPVAILGGPSLDVGDVDTLSLLFGGLSARVRGNKGPQCGIEDSNGDGVDDLVCQFEDDPDNWVAGDDTATLTGNLADGTSFEGTDSICIVP